MEQREAKVRGEDPSSEMDQMLETIWQDRSVEEMLERLTAIVEQGEAGSIAAVMVLREGRLERAAGKLPERVQTVLDGMGTRLAVQLRTAAGEQVRGAAVSDLAREPVWKKVRAGLRRRGLRKCCWAPIASGDGSLLGLFLWYCRNGKGRLGVLEMAGKAAALAIERGTLAERLVYQTQHDALTRLPNRFQLGECLRQELARARRHSRPAAVLFIDLDRFTLINETLGQGNGDRLLQEVAGRLQRHLRETDTLVRMGDDEFVVIASELNGRQDAARRAQKLLEGLKEPVEMAGREVVVTASIGIGMFPDDGPEEMTLQRNAQAAMQQAKAGGGHCFRYYAPEMNSAAYQRLELEGELRQALGSEQLMLHYQPQVDRRGQLLGVEALLRWKHPQRGLIPPSQFIPLAEESGLIIPIGNWALSEACRQNAAWQAAGYAPLRMAVNVSAMQFAQDEFVELVTAALHKSRLKPRWLELELTESMLVHGSAVPKLQRLHRLGVSVAIDDFGTGFGSMSYLQRLPVDTLKIDCSFVKQIGQKPPRSGRSSETVIIKAIASLGRDLGMGVVAEGVETRQQARFVLRMGCTGLQGFLYSPALPAKQLETVLECGLGKAA